MTSQDIARHFRRALGKGFTKDHIRAVLLGKGYDKKEVNKAYSLIPDDLDYDAEIKKPTNLIPVFIVLLVVISAAIFLTAHRFYSQQYEEKSLTTKEVAQQKIDQISDISTDIDNKQRQINEQLDEISTLNASVQEKEEIIQRQIVELKMINEQISQERARIKDLLMDLLNTILHS